jgi:hypothetical protein
LFDKKKAQLFFTLKFQAAVKGRVSNFSASRVRLEGVGSPQVAEKVTQQAPTTSEIKVFRLLRVGPSLAFSNPPPHTLTQHKPFTTLLPWTSTTCTSLNLVATGLQTIQFLFFVFSIEFFEVFFMLQFLKVPILCILSGINMFYVLPKILKIIQHITLFNFI